MNIYNMFGRMPTFYEICKYSKFGHGIYKKYCGSTFLLALKYNLIKFDNNINTRKYKFYSDEECLNILKQETDKKLKYDKQLLTAKEIDLNYSMPSMDTYTRKFGGIKKSYEMIGVDYDYFNKDVIKHEVIQEYLYLCKKYNKTLTIWEYEDFTKIRSTKMIPQMFGNFINLQNECGLTLNSHGKLKYTKDELKVNLLKLYNTINRKITQYDIDICEYLPSASTITTYFGSIANALKEIGVPNEIIKTKECVTPNGVVCFSRYEYLFARTLEIYNIEFEKEVSYRKYIPNLKQ